MKLAHNVFIYILLCLVLVVIVPLIKYLFFEDHSISAPSEEVKENPIPEDYRKNPFSAHRAPITKEALSNFRSCYSHLRKYSNEQLKYYQSKDPSVNQFSVYLVTDNTPIKIQKITEIVPYEKLKLHSGLYMLYNFPNQDWKWICYHTLSGRFEVVFNPSSLELLSSSLVLDREFVGKRNGEYEIKQEDPVRREYYYLGNSWCYIVVVPD